ncbi:MAG: hypothetical protein ACRCYU_01925 [Nocardioides sp.]
MSDTPMAPVPDSSGDPPAPESSGLESPEADTADQHYGDDGVGRGAAPPKRLGFLVVAVLFLALIFGVRWWYVTSQALSKVSVEVSQPACDDTTIGEVTIKGQTIAAPRPVPGMRCEVTINIANSGTVGVRISKVVASGLGPESRLPVQAAAIDGRTPQGAGPDAEYQVNQGIGPNALIEVKIAYEYRQEGCITGEAFTSMNWPTVDATMSKRTKAVSATRGFALTSTPETRC